ncbi:MAG: type II secretion system minor pseudopilin GspK [Gammaproteobacteria bacterium]|nr:type II secretion system minor pseudopilin GspK [Gammaproteobacteria bacterium]TVQ46047.1 MAG: general secretion pathway protein GspK [Gammaproteobacteria bacterium]
MRRAGRERGVAVITAILIVAIATTIAVNMLWRSQLDQRRTAAQIQADQAWLYLRGAEALAADILRQDLLEFGPDSDHLGEIWAQRIDPLPVDGGFVSGEIEDLQGRFNLNNLIDAAGQADPVAVEWFQRLLRVLELDPELAWYVVDWLDADTQPSFPVGAEDGAYTGREPPYRPPNLPVTSTSELLAVEGFDAEAYAALRPFVAALPQGTALNVNTAPAEVLASLDDGLGIASALQLIEQRGDQDFPDYLTLFAPLVSENVLPRLGERSSHFRLTARAAIGSTQLTMYSLLFREANGVVRPLLRSLGTE